jgi:very-short-patch-repair endonuclease
MLGISFRRQHPVGPYILDFYCSAAKLAIELDGDQHAVQREYDDARTQFLNRKGIQVVRFWNVDLKEKLEGCLDTISRRVLELGGPPRPARAAPPPTRSASRSDLPLSGGGDETESEV